MIGSEEVVDLSPPEEDEVEKAVSVAYVPSASTRGFELEALESPFSLDLSSSSMPDILGALSRSLASSLYLLYHGAIV